VLVAWRYRDRGSIIQSFDPRAWVIFYLCFIVTTLFFWDLRYLAVLFVIAGSSVLASRLSWKDTRRTWLFMGGFIIFFSLLTFLTGRGGVEVYSQEHMLADLRAPFQLFGWRPALTISAERLFFALSILARVFSLAAMTVLIPYTLPPDKYGVTFRGLGLPDKFAYGMDLTMRFIPTFGRDFSQTLDAQKARGYELEKLSGGIVSQVRKLAPIVVPVTIRALMSSEDIIDAMDLRAFATGPRTWVAELRYRRRDYALIAFGALLMLVGFSLSLFGFGKFWVPAALIG
jgi:energy-coupling factor transport system permease protein